MAYQPSSLTKKDFFISFSKVDRDWAEWIATQLEQAGYSTVFQAWDFQPGANFIQEMDKSRQEAKHIMPLLSPDYLNSYYTRPEWAVAFRDDPKGEQRLLVPVRVRPCEVTGLLQPISFIDLVGLDEPEASMRLLESLAHES